MRLFFLSLLVTFSLQAQTILHLRYGGGPKITITNATNATPIQITTATAHGFSVGDVVWIWGIDGNWNADGTRRVKTVVDSTNFTIAYCGDSNCSTNGADAAGNGTFAAMSTCKDGGTGPCSTGGGNLLGAWVGTTVPYTMTGNPCCDLDGPSGAITTRLKDPDGAGAGIAPRLAVGNPAGDAIKNTANAKLTTANVLCSANDITCWGWQGPNFGLIRGSNFGLMAAVGFIWYGDNTQTSFHDAVVHWLQNLERVGETSACDTSQASCNNNVDMDYTIGYNASAMSVVYELGRAELTSGQRTAALNVILNDNTDGATCTSAVHVGTGTVTDATGVLNGATNTFTGSGTNWLSTVSPGDVITFNISTTYLPHTITQVVDDTHMYYRAQGGSGGDLPVIFSGKSYGYAISKPNNGTTDCGIINFGKHSGYSPLSPAGQYYDSSSTIYADTFGNQYLTKNAQFLKWGLATANDDKRGVRLAENAANFWDQVQWPLYQQWWNGPTQIDSQYGPDRFGEFITNTVSTIYNATGGAVNYLTDRWLKDREMWNIYYDLPTSTSGNRHHIGYGTSNIAQDNVTKVVDQYTMATLTAGSTERNYALWWRNNVRGDFTSAAIGFGSQCQGCYFPYMFSDPLDGVGTDYTSVIPTSRAFNRRNAAAEAVCPDCGTNTIIDRTGFTSTNDTLLFVNSFGIWRSTNHLSSASIDNNANPAEYFLLKHSYMLGGDINAGNLISTGAASGTDNCTQATDHSNYFEFGGVNKIKLIRPDLDPSLAMNLPIRRFDGTDNNFMYSLVDVSNAYTPATGITQFSREFADFKVGNQYLVVLDNVATPGVAQMYRTYMHFTMNGETGEGATTFTQATNSVSSLDQAGGARLNTKWLFPTTAGFTYVDNPAGTYTGGLGHTFRVSACLGTGTDATGCSASTTSGQIMAVHQISMNQSLTMPTLETPAATGFATVQIDDTSDPDFAAFNLSSTLATSFSATTTFSGTGHHILAGFAPGAYDVKVGGTPVSGSPFTVASGVNDIHFNATAGGLTVAASSGGGGSCSITTTTLPNGTVGTAYSQTLGYTGCVPTNTWTVTAGALPGGLTLGSSTGTISGTPTTAGTFAFTVHVADSGILTADQNLSITISGVVVITTLTLPGGTRAQAYSQTISVTGGTAPYTWATIAGGLPGGSVLPPGITLNTSTGVISGTPTAVGSYPIDVQVTDTNGIQDAQVYTINILGVPSLSLRGVTQK